MSGMRLRRWTLVALFDFGAPVSLTIATVHELGYDGSPWTKWVCALALVWTLVARRRFPIAVFAVALVLSGVLSTWSPTVAELTLVVALYSVAAHRPLRAALVCGIVLEAGVVIAVFEFAPTRSIDDYVIVLSGVAAAALFLGTTLRTNRRYLTEVEHRAARLEREQAQQAELGAAEERARIAREMHDIIAHGLAIIVTLSEGAAATASKDADRAAEVMRQVAATGRASLDETRRLLRVLRTDQAESRAPQPDLEMLPALLDDVRSAGLRVRLDSNVHPGTLEQGAEATLYRVVQESLTNVLKHAERATTVTVTLRAIPGKVGFSVVDDGRRRGSPPSTDGAGNGIDGMRERVGMFDGTVEAGPAATGWTVSGSITVAPTALKGAPV